MDELWPIGYEVVQQILQGMMARNPRFEEMWYGYIMTMTIYVFPAMAPNLYYIRPQCPLREVLAIADEVAGRTSLDSQGHAVLARSQGREPGVAKPDFVVVRGPRGQQRTVLLIEVKNENSITSKDAKRFMRYCNRVVEFGDRASHAAVMLIAGGVVYTWRRPELPALVLEDPLDNDRLALLQEEPNRCVNVDSPQFIQLLRNLKHDFELANPML
jgi:hypothetical protein